MAFLTRTELLASYADNVTNDIVAGTHRNLVESLMVYGSLNTTNYVTTITGTPTKLVFDTSLFAFGMTANIANNEFDNVEQGHYMMHLNIDAELNNRTYTFYIYTDGTPLGDGFEWNAKDAGQRVNLAWSIPFILTTDAGTMDLRASADKNSATTFNNIDWVMHRLGS